MAVARKQEWTEPALVQVHLQGLKRTEAVEKAFRQGFADSWLGLKWMDWLAAVAGPGRLRPVA
jgi:hypothetical protein